MIHRIEMTDTTTGQGTGEFVLWAQYMLNDNQVVSLISKSGFELDEDKPGFESVHWGKLSEVNFIMAAQLRNSLAIDDWPLEEYPDPEVIFTSRIR